jgi:hypothetical protein
MEITTGVDAGLELNTNDLYNVTSNTLQGETDTLYVRLSATEFHSYEQMWVDNLQVHGTPEPMTVALLSLGGLFLRRKK